MWVSSSLPHAFVLAGTVHITDATSFVGIDFVSLREIPAKDAEPKEDQKSNGNIATREKAEELGVDLTTLAKGVSKIRADADPVLSAVSQLINVSQLFQVSAP